MKHPSRGPVHPTGKPGVERTPPDGNAGRGGAASDEEITSRVARGETALYEVLVHRYERPLIALLQRWVGTRQSAEEIAQEAFVKAFMAIDRFDPAFRFGTWLYRIAWNAAIDARRRQHLRLVSLEEPAGPGAEPGDQRIEDRLAAAGPSPDAALVRNDERRVLAAAVERLPADYREIVLLRHSAGLSYEEMAQVLDMPLGTIKNRLHRARRRLKEILEGGEPGREPARTAPDWFLREGPED